MKKTLCMILSVLLLSSMTLSLAACGARPQDAKDLMEDITAGTPSGVHDLATDSARLTDFGVRLFQASKSGGKNTLVSPLSVLCALAMTANGAKGETREQMEAVLGMKAEDLNEYLYTYVQGLRENGSLALANSIWFTDNESFKVNGDFLQINADYYGADLYKTPFDDDACQAINDWVKEKTHGMIPRILDQIPADAVMYLVNALAFEAEWAAPYDKKQVEQGDFTREDGSRLTVDYLYGDVGQYLRDENAQGFLKLYKGGDYAFAALLPDEGVSVDDYVASLTGARLHQLLTHPESATVHTSIPKFESDFSAELGETLAGMGMPLAFDGARADFTGLGTADENIYISRVLHKTYISVTEKGTKAGAATVVEMMKNTSVQIPQEIKTVYLDRPF
ncbi:MAG: serpin family protein, partial [Oscillospiraceae bacterium]|nr:serpin family protein [Oscillospiraceae bacterium]